MEGVVFSRLVVSFFKPSFVSGALSFSPSLFLIDDALSLSPCFFVADTLPLTISLPLGEGGPQGGLGANASRQPKSGG